jgi:hypothetical protein
VPIISVQITGQGGGPAGTPVNLPPSIGLLQQCPCLQVAISPSTAIVQQLTASGHPVPPPISGPALLDTGAFSTCVDIEVAQELKLPVIDQVTIATPSHTQSLQPVYPIRFEVIGFGVNFDAPRTMGAPLKPQGIIALIGRDVLQNCCLISNGHIGQFHLAI